MKRVMIMVTGNTADEISANLRYICDDIRKSLRKERLVVADGNGTCKWTATTETRDATKTVPGDTRR